MWQTNRVPRKFKLEYFGEMRKEGSTSSKWTFIQKELLDGNENYADLTKMEILKLKY
jgi:hypothetical protein